MDPEGNVPTLSRLYSHLTQLPIYSMTDKPRQSKRKPSHVHSTQRRPHLARHSYTQPEAQSRFWGGPRGGGRAHPAGALVRHNVATEIAAMHIAIVVHRT